MSTLVTEGVEALPSWSGVDVDGQATGYYERGSVTELW